MKQPVVLSTMVERYASLLDSAPDDALRKALWL
jgi:hypothetical protein